MGAAVHVASEHVCEWRRYGVRLFPSEIHTSTSTIVIADFRRACQGLSVWKQNDSCDTTTQFGVSAHPQAGTPPSPLPIQKLQNNNGFSHQTQCAPTDVDAARVIHLMKMGTSWITAVIHDPLAAL